MSQDPGAADAPIRVMIVDGDGNARQHLARRCLDAGDFAVVGTAMNGRTALAKLPGYRPDVVLVDLVDADVEGLAFAAALRRQHPATGLVLLVEDDVLDGLQKPPDPALHPYELVARQQALGGAVPSLVLAARAAAGRTRQRHTATSPKAPAPRPPAASPRTSWRAADAQVVGIGTSTGGPNALTAMLPHLPADFPLPVLVVQHMPPVFTASLAQSLTRVCKLPVREATHGEPVRPGQILIAPGGFHMRVVARDGGKFVELTQDAPEHGCRPAVDVLFRSLDAVYGGRTIAVMMTGMGEDGFAACKALHRSGAWIVAQDEASCTVYGMPRGPIEAGLADAVAPLDRLAECIQAAAPKGVRA
jgi:two-component system chemotaxis response regulator CheB